MRGSASPTTDVAEREAFCAVLSNGPLLYGDAIVVLSGDGTIRLEVGLQLFKQQSAPHIVVSGALNDVPRSLHARAAESWLGRKGVARSKIHRCGGLHTYEEACAVLGMAVENQWGRLLLCTSPYHQYRALLTYVRVLMEEGNERKIHIVNVPASQTQWWGCPEGLGVTRVELLGHEFRKIDEYSDHVASYADGLAYLRYWEGS